MFKPYTTLFLYVISFEWMTKLIRLLERRWRFTKNLDADFLNQCSKRLSNSNLPIKKFPSVLKPRCRSFTRAENFGQPIALTCFVMTPSFWSSRRWATRRRGDSSGPQLPESWWTPKGVAYQFRNQKSAASALRLVPRRISQNVILKKKSA